MKYHSFLNIFIVTQPDFACIPLLCTGRVLAVTGQANDFKEALRRAYEAVSKISFDPPGSSSCLAVQQVEALLSPLSLSLSLPSCRQPFVYFMSVPRQSMLFHPVFLSRAFISLSDFHFKMPWKFHSSPAF